MSLLIFNKSFELILTIYSVEAEDNSMETVL